MKFDETVKRFFFKSHESQQNKHNLHSLMKQVKVQVEHDKNWLCCIFKAIYIQAVPSMLWGFLHVLQI